MTLSNVTIKNFAQAVRRGTHRHAKASIDMNADFQGRRLTGDPRLDLAAVERFLKF